MFKVEPGSQGTWIEQEHEFNPGHGTVQIGDAQAAG